MNDILKGECLCGKMKYEVKNDFKAFYLCHCKQCQKLTGSAFASNLFTSPENIVWLSGRERVLIYEHPTREFTKAFCEVCGSGVPFINKSGRSLIVPAGTLADAPTIVPQANIFTSEKACWLHEGMAAKEFRGFPE